MADHIIDVISISPATGFIFSDDGSDTVCFALVSSVSTVHPGLAPGGQIIALGKDKIGTEINERMLSVESKPE